MAKTVSVIGGDLRQLTLYKLLQKDGYNVLLYGFDKLYEVKCETNFELIKNSDIVILPMPVSTDKEHINAIYSSFPIKIGRVSQCLSSASLVFGGQIGDELLLKLSQRGVKCFDYLNREELAISNAVPTAEGAINIAISETPYTIHNSSCLVIGYGRIGKILSKMLSGLGANVTVAARNHTALAQAAGFGHNTALISELSEIIGWQNIIFNTVPHLMLNYHMLKLISDDALIIDLASRPGGVDFEAAKQFNVKVIWALSLPGKIAPETSGKIIKATIINILNELEV